ncbi:MAG: HypC/HybG/HupF family hydrogenase formation chaperone [Deltaproteobacteria bacterium]|nr:MAG: HypC/HybG/HupF family hydrogenase formation chaperone [Deltaproteobacteria bacterium]
MCLAVPMTVVEIAPDGSGVVELEGVRRSVRLDLLEGPAVGDIVIVHAGYAIETLDPAEAEARMALFARLAETYERELGAPVRLVAGPGGDEGRS